MKVDQRSIFLIDGIGAMISAVSLGLLLPLFQDHIGLPLVVLRSLGALAAFFAAYSLTCHRFADTRNPRFILGLLVLNTSYCLLAIGVMGAFYSSLLPLGWLYFISEKIVVLALIWLEFSVFRRMK